MSNNLTFEDGVVFAVQEIVINYDEPSMAREILKTAGLSIEEFKVLVNKSGYATQKMDSFIKEELSP